MPANWATYICSWPEEVPVAASLSIKIWCSNDGKNVNLFLTEWRKTPRRACFIQTGMAWRDSASYWRKQSSWLITRFPFHWISCPVQACSANTVTCRSNFCEQTQPQCFLQQGRESTAVTMHTCLQVVVWVWIHWVYFIQCTLSHSTWSSHALVFSQSPYKLFVNLVQFSLT